MFKKSVAAAIVAVSALVSAPAFAGPGTPTAVLHTLTKDQSTAMLYGNIIGILDVIPKGIVCAPPTMTIDDAKALVQAAIDMDTELLEMPLSAVTLGTLMKKFPCKTTPKAPAKKADKGAML